MSLEINRAKIPSGIRTEPPKFRSTRQNFLRQSSAYFKVTPGERREPGIWFPPLTGREMSAMTPRRIALVALATAGLLVPAAMLLARHDRPGSIGVGAVGPVGALIMGTFATGCAVNAAWAARGGQRFAWVALATGLGGWAAGNALWCYVALRGTAPFSASSAAELGYVVLPLCALGATVLVPNRDDYRFGFGLLFDGILVAASLFLALGILVLGAEDRASIPRVVMAVVTAFYLGLVVIASIVVRTAERGRRLSPALLTAGFAAVGIAGVVLLPGDRADHIP